MVDKAISTSPLILCINGYTDEIDYILANHFTKHVFPGISPRVVKIDGLDLFFDEDVEGLKEEKPDFDEEQLEVWRKSQEFAELVIHRLLDKLREATDDLVDLDAVRVIILDSQSYFTADVEKALKDSFPNAFICDSDGEGEITYLSSMPIDELSLKKSVLNSLKSSRLGVSTAYASWLANKTEAQLLGLRGIGKSALQNIKDALAEHNVELRQE